LEGAWDKVVKRFPIPSKCKLKSEYNKFKIKRRKKIVKNNEEVK